MGGVSGTERRNAVRFFLCPQVVGDTVPEFREHYSEGGVIAGLVGRRALTADGRDDSFGSCARPCLEHDVEVVAGLTV